MWGWKKGRWTVILCGWQKQTETGASRAAGQVVAAGMKVKAADLTADATNVYTSRHNTNSGFQLPSPHFHLQKIPLGFFFLSLSFWSWLLPSPLCHCLCLTTCHTLTCPSSPTTSHLFLNDGEEKKHGLALYCSGNTKSIDLCQHY